MEKFAGWHSLLSKFFHANLLIQAQLQDYGTEKLISDDFLVTWSRDQLLQKAYSAINLDVNANYHLITEPVRIEGRSPLL